MSDRISIDTAIKILSETDRITINAVKPNTENDVKNNSESLLSLIMALRSLKAWDAVYQKIYELPVSKSKDDKQYISRDSVLNIIQSQFEDGNL